MRIGVTVLAMAATMAVAATAQTAPVVPDAPSAAPRPEFVRDPQAVLWGYRSTTPQAVPKPLRSAVPDGDIVTWLPVDDPAVQGLVTDPEARGYASLRLSVDARGRVAACEASQRHNMGELPAFLGGLCDRIAQRARFVPAIDDSGTRVADVYQLTIGFDRFGRRASDPATPLVVEREPSPVPMMARDEWPPRWTYASPTFADLPLAENGAAAHAANSAPWSGVELRQDATGRLSARTVVSSQDSGFDQSALRIARQSGPQWPDSSELRQRRAMIHFTSVDGGPAAILPVSTAPTYPRVTDAERAVLVAAIDWSGATADAKARLHFALNIDNGGRVTSCRIERSSGSDSGDVAGCRTVREMVRFEPYRDIFGWAHPWFLFDWPLVAAPPR